MEEYHGNTIVSVLLSGSNYEEWSFQIKNYLLARDLWDVVAKSRIACRPKGDDRKFKLKAWRRRNAAALHAILISCGSSYLPLIKDIKSARTAWATLADSFSQCKSQNEDQVVIENRLTVENQTNTVPDQTQSVAAGGSNEQISQVVVNPNVAVEFLQYEPFFKAVYRGDWDTASVFLEQHPEAVRVRTPGFGKTALQVAVTEEHVDIVRKLVEKMTEQELEIAREDGFTALAAAIEVGNLEIAKCLIRKNKKLISIIQQAYGLPVVHAVVTGQKHMVHYLYAATPAEDLILPDEGRRGASLLSQCIFVQHFDIALHLLERAPYLAITDDVPGKSPVCALAHSKVFPSGSSLKFWQQWIYSFIHIPASSTRTNHITIEIQNQQDGQRPFQRNTTMVIGSETFQRCKEVLSCLLRCGCSYLLTLLDIKGIYEMKLFHVQSLELLRLMCKVIENTSDEEKIKRAGVNDALIAAVYAGNVEFISNIAKANSPLVWNPYVARRVFEVAVEHRQAKIFSLIYGLRDKIAIVSYRDENNSNMLHKAAAVAPSRLLKLIPGAALQMQRELQWFKEVETLASPAAREWTNKEYLKPRALFTENHKDLVVEGEKWMKDTSSSSTVVGALIVTVTFAAAFTFPGGNDQNSGFPMFLGFKLFKVFMMSNAVALFASTTSVLMFLGILTSRYGEEDFLKSLPKKLIIGLSTLFISIAAMIIAFCAGFSVMFHKQSWVVVPSICLACIPVSFFVLMQFPLLVDMFMSTYGPSIFDRNLKRWI